jgi:hypothetical protein
MHWDLLSQHVRYTFCVHAKNISSAVVGQSSVHIRLSAVVFHIPAGVYSAYSMKYKANTKVSDCYCDLSSFYLSLSAVLRFELRASVGRALLGRPSIMWTISPTFFLRLELSSFLLQVLWSYVIWYICLFSWWTDAFTKCQTSLVISGHVFVLKATLSVISITKISFLCSLICCLFPILLLLSYLCS